MDEEAHEIEGIIMHAIRSARRELVPTLSRRKQSTSSSSGGQYIISLIKIELVVTIDFGASKKIIRNLLQLQ